MMDKDKKIEDLRQKISYLTEKLKITYSTVERADIADQILIAKKELGNLQSKALDRVRKVDVIDAAPVADRIEIEAHRSRSGLSIKNTKNRTIVSF